MTLLKGESTLLAETEPLATMHIVGIKAAPAGQERIEVTCDIYRCGKLVLSAKEYPSGRELQSYVQFKSAQ
jgi:molecular chaperone DnaK (HSP70)